MPDRVIFLDIDGPMIPSHQVLAHPMASWHRIFPDSTVAVLKDLCRRTGAKVVFNTYHNNPIKDVPDIDVALANAGFDRAHYHKHFKTLFPFTGGYFSQVPSRMNAITEWLKQHDSEAEWVCFDDECFTTDKRLILIDYDVGITLKDSAKALQIFGFKRTMSGDFVDEAAE